MARSVWRFGEEGAAVGHDDGHEPLGIDQASQCAFDRGKRGAAQIGRQPPVAYAARRIPRIGEPAQMLQNGGGNGIDAVSVTHGTDRSLGDSRSGSAIAAQLLDCTPRARCRNLSPATSYPKNAAIDAGAAAPGRRRDTCANPARSGCFRPFSPKWGSAASAGQGRPGHPRLDLRRLPARHDPAAACPGSGSDALWSRSDRPSGWRPPADLKSFEGGPARRLSGRIIRGSGRANASSSSEDRYGSRKADPLGVPYNAKTSFEAGSWGRSLATSVIRGLSGKDTPAPDLGG